MAPEERAASADGPGAFGAIFSRDIGLERLSALIGEPLARAREAGLADPTWTVGDVVLVIHMLHGVRRLRPTPPTCPLRSGAPWP